MDDDSSPLPEVMELFSDIALPIKVDRLMKVGQRFWSNLILPAQLSCTLICWQVSDLWRQKAATASEGAAKDSQAAEEGNQQEKEGEEGEETVKEGGAVAASSGGETEDPNRAKRATCEVCIHSTTLNTL